MKKKNKDRLLNKMAFVVKNLELCDEGFKKYSSHGDWKRLAGRKLLKKYKEEIKFSKTTANCDILYSLWGIYKNLTIIV